MYYAGNGVGQDRQEAARLYTLAAAQGHVYAQCNLGLMYKRGEGVAQNCNEALKLFHLAAAQGDAKAQCNIGVMHFQGEGSLAKDIAEGVRWIRLAASQDDWHAVARIL